MTLHSLMDVKVLADPMITLQLGVLKCKREQTQQFTAAIGLGFIAGSKITKATTKKLGKAGHTTLCHIFAAFFNLLLGIFPSSATLIIRGFGEWIGDQKPHYVKEAATGIALESKKIGRGEL